VICSVDSAEVKYRRTLEIDATGSGTRFNGIRQDKKTRVGAAGKKVDSARENNLYR